MRAKTGGEKRRAPSHPTPKKQTPLSPNGKCKKGGGVQINEGEAKKRLVVKLIEIAGWIVWEDEGGVRDLEQKN